MNGHLAFDFTVNKEQNCIEVTREFNAELSLVWKAWTEPSILDQWWAPKPYQTKTRSMKFEVGGSWLYAMIGPEDTPHWCKADYLSIEPLKSFAGLDGFCDENGVLNTSLPRSEWNISFEGRGEKTVVTIVIKYASLTDLEQIITMGFKEGFSMAMENLDQYIAAQGQLRTALGADREARVCTYLNFPGNTEEAFLFYQTVFQTAFTGNGIQRFGDLPADASHPPVAESVKNMVLHVELPITANHILMGTDAPKEMGFTVKQGNNMHISLEPSTRAEAKRLFDALSVNGTISMPLQDMFWGAYFGSFSDQFGINWMINCLARS